MARRTTSTLVPLEIGGIALNVVMLAAWLFASPVPTTLRESHATFAKAERSLRETRFVNAYREYAFIGEKFAHMPIAEDATYKAGWIAMWRIGDLADARMQFERYRDRFPEGRFLDQVKSGLDMLDRIPVGREAAGRLVLTAEILEERGEFVKALSLVDFLLERTRGTKLLPKLYEIRKRVEDKKFEMESLERW